LKNIGKQTIQLQMQQNKNKQNHPDVKHSSV